MEPGTNHLYASWWTRTAPEVVYEPPPGDAEADVVVVGGGMAGICTAWELARAGRSVIVAEADRIASGVTGHTSAKLSALQGMTYTRLTAMFGPEAARLYATSQQEAVEQIGAAADGLGIDCDWERVDAFTFSLSGKREKSLRAETEAANAAGLPAEYVPPGQAPFNAARGAVRLPDQAQFHPGKFLHGLASDIVTRGGRIFEQTRVTGLHEGSPCRLETGRGTRLTAQDVVVATHYPVFDRALLFPRMASHRELVVAAPLPEEQDPRGMYLTDEENTRSLRTAPYQDGKRLLIVTGEKFTPGSGHVEERYDRLTAWALRHFPDAVPLYRWAAQDNWTTDGVPFVGRLHPAARHTSVATGFGGWGLSGGMMAARLLTSLITDGDLPWERLYDPRRLSLRREGGALLKQQTHTARHFIGDRLTADSDSSGENIDPGKGKVIRRGACHYAVSRDDDGTLHTLSARCTHLGCLVQFNDAERTWDCPCHGSRFAIDGSVLQGPATQPLKPATSVPDG
ncbi:FAD-dependent oxidoreductase [Streptomyces sp. NPDC056500]|uniref:FAD-dependent oxidoreductase n=1 Tax=Streptomyces sp. NPDC056500 TaxID=3345840 RepID=UPI0036736BAD